MTYEWTIVCEDKEPIIVDAENLSEASKLATVHAEGGTFSVWLVDPIIALRESAIEKLMSGTALTQDEANLITGSTSN